jgi:uncharacterized membrane protein YfcA
MPIDMPDWTVFVLVGLFAQLADGALGMGYGITASSFLAALGVPPVAATATVHFSETFTTGASAISHASFRNVDRALVKALLLPGIAGGVAGALLISHVPTDIIKPLVSAYLVLMGVRLLRQALGKPPPAALRRTPTPWLGGIAGFLDAIGGGGWGPLTAPALIRNGTEPRYSIGSVNTTEFFVTAAISAVLIPAVEREHLFMAAGLVAGGLVAAPVSAMVVRRIPVRGGTILLACVVLALSGSALWRELMPYLR